MKRYSEKKDRLIAVRPMLYSDLKMAISKESLGKNLLNGKPWNLLTTLWLSGKRSVPYTYRRTREMLFTIGELHAEHTPCCCKENRNHYLTTTIDSMQNSKPWKQLDNLTHQQKIWLWISFTRPIWIFLENF